MSTNGEESSSLRDELHLRKRQIDAIRRISAELFLHNDVEDMLCKTLAVAVDVLGADVGSIQVHDPVTDSLVFHCVRDPGAQRLLGQSYPVSQGIGGLVFRSGKALATQHVQEQSEFNPHIDELTGYHTETMLTVPLHCFDKPCMGIMQVLNSKRSFDETDLAVFEALGAQAATLIESARMEKEAQRAGLVSSIGDIAHDIKNMLTPLHAGVVTLELIVEDSLNSLNKVRDKMPPDETWGGEIEAAVDGLRKNYQWIFTCIKSAAERVQASTGEIADAAKGEVAAPFFELNNINSVVDDVIDSLRPIADREQLNLTADLHPKLAHFPFDYRQIFNALYNLVNNAIPETPAGGKITVRTYPQDAGIIIEVSDTGRGIPADVLESLFTDDAISTKTYGTGLGTRIVASVVKRHGGRVSVKSDPGEGSTFTIYLPCG